MMFAPSEASGPAAGGGTTASSQNGDVLRKRLVTLNKRSSTSFGFKIRHPLRPHSKLGAEGRPMVVHRCGRNSVGAAAGIRMGDILLIVAGQNVQTLSIKHVRRMLEVAAETHHPIDISVLRPTQPQWTRRQSLFSRIIRYLFKRKEHAPLEIEQSDTTVPGVHIKSDAFGNNMSSDAGQSSTTSKLLPHRTNSFPAGINDMSVPSSTAESAEVLAEDVAATTTTEKQSLHSVASEMPSTDAASKEHSPATVSASPSGGGAHHHICTKLSKGPTGYGLMFGGAKSCQQGEQQGWGILISGKTPGSSSAANDNIIVGWQLVGLSGIDLTEAIFDDLKSALRAVKSDEIELELELNTDLAASYGIAIDGSTSSTSISPTAPIIEVTEDDNTTVDDGSDTGVENQSAHSSVDRSSDMVKQPQVRRSVVVNPAVSNTFDLHYHSQHGTRHGDLNQDNGFCGSVHGQTGEMSVAAVFDGHGLLGERAAAVAKQAMQDILNSERLAEIVAAPESTMEWIFEQLQIAVLDDHRKPPSSYIYPGRPGSESLEFELVDVGGVLGQAFNCKTMAMPPAPIDYGCTAVVAVAFNSTVVIGNLGDAGAVLCFQDQDSYSAGELLSATHTAKDPTEIARIERDFGDKSHITQDGYLAPLDDILGGYEVQLTRSLGHPLLSNFGVSSQPQVHCLDLVGKRVFAIVLCSDGITDELKPTDIAERVEQNDRSEVASILCQDAQDFCMDTNKVDDCTAVVMLVNDQELLGCDV